MANEADRLNIEITARATEAHRSISLLIQKLQGLKTALSDAGKSSGAMANVAKEAQKAESALTQVAKKSPRVVRAPKIDTSSVKQAVSEIEDGIDAVIKRIKTETWIPEDLRKSLLTKATADVSNSPDPAQTLKIRAQILTDMLDHQKSLVDMTEKERAAKEAVVKQDEEKLRLYKEANALMRESMPSTAYNAGGGTFVANGERYRVEDYLPGGRRYDEAMARRNAPPTPPVEEPTQSAEAMERVAEAGEQLRESLDATGTSASSFKDKFRGVASVMGKVAPVALNLLNAIVRVQKFFLNFTIGAFSEGLRQAARLTKALAGHLASLAKRLISMPFKALGNNAKSSVGGMSDALRQGARFVTRYILGFRSLFYLARRLRSAISGAFTNLSQYSEQTNANLSLLSSRLEQAKNSLATAFDPILTIITPILNHFIQLLIGALNVVGQFFATLSGASTWKKATFNMTDFAASADKSAASSGKAADAADELKKSLMGFDKINKLDDPNKSSSGSGGGGGSGSSGLSGADMFTTENVSTGISNFAQMIKDAWAKEDFTDVGNFIGEKIGTALSNIPWDKAKKKAEGFAKSFATFFNGLLASEITDNKGNKITLGDAIGNAIAETINTGITFLQTLTDTIEFDKIGSFIASGMNTMTIKVNWDGIAKTLSNAANGVFNIAATWSGKFKFGALATEIKDTVKKALDGITWDKAEEAATNIGNGLATALNVFFTDDMFDSISTALGKAVNTAITAGYTFIGRIEWKQWGETIKNGIVNFFGNIIDWKKIGVTAENLCTGLGTVVNTIFDTGNTLIGRIEWKEWGETIKNGINNFFDTVNWKSIGVTAQNIATGLAKAINTLFEGAYTLLGRIEWKQWGFTVGTAITNFFKTINWGTLGITFNDAVQGLLSGLTSTLETVDFETLGEGLVTALSKINWGELFKKAAKLIVVAGEALTEFVAGLLSGLQAALEDWVREHFPKIIADIILTGESGSGGTNERVNGSDSSLGWTPESNPDSGGGSSGRGIGLPWNPVEQVKVQLSAEKDQSYIDNIDNDYKKTGNKDATATAKASTTKQWNEMFGDSDAKWKHINNKDVVATAKGKKDPTYTTAIEEGYEKVPLEKPAEIKATADLSDEYKAVTEYGNDRKDGYVSLPPRKDAQIVMTGTADATYQNVMSKDGSMPYSSVKNGETKSAKVKIKGTAEQSKVFKNTIKTWEALKADKKGKIPEKTLAINGKGDSDSVFKKVGKVLDEFAGKNKLTKSAQLNVDGKQTDEFEESTSAFNRYGGQTKTATLKAEGKPETSFKKIAGALKAAYSGQWSTVASILTYFGEKGGAFYGGAWHGIPQFATGGVPTRGTVFVAGEKAGNSEIVGNIGGRTEILNQSQMASVMYDAVLRGMVQALSVTGNATEVHVHLDGDARNLFRVVQREANNYTNSTGQPAFNF